MADPTELDGLRKAPERWQAETLDPGTIDQEFG